MIRPLRSAHRAIFLAAAVVLPALLVAGLRARRPLPLAATASLPAATQAGPPVIWQTTSGTALVTLLRASADSTVLSIEISPATAFRGPDLLLYWTPLSLPVAEIGQSEILLGPVSGEPVRRLRLPSSVQPGQGSLLLFSLAHHAMAGGIALPTAPVSAP